jgi:fibronectin type 3 domain-containing protein
MRLLAFLAFLLSAASAAAQAPGPATGLTAVAVANKSIKLTWIAPAVTAENPAATGYKVYRATTANPTPEELTTTAITALTYTDTSSALVVGTSYTYTVVAFNGALAASPSSPATAIPVDSPNAPANLRATDINSDSVTLAWNAVADAESYTVYRDGDAVGTDLTGTTFTDTGLDLSTTYSYVVTSTSSLGDESGDSNILTVTTFGDGTGKEAVWAKRFRQIDIDADHLLTLEEYLDGHTARLAKVIGIHRFEYSDTDESGDLTLTEYAKALGGRKFFSPTKPRQFYLADRYFLLEGEEPDGYLDDFEFALTLGSKTKPTKVTAAFNKKDKNGSTDLSEFEFGIRNGSIYDSEELPPTP